MRNYVIPAVFLLISAANPVTVHSQDSNLPQSEVGRIFGEDLSSEALTYRTMSELKTVLTLEHKQFEKISKSYKKYFDKLNTSKPERIKGMPPGGNHGFGGRRPPVAGLERPVEGFDMMRQSNNRPEKAPNENIEKQKKERDKAETQLAKNIGKVLSAEQFDIWQQWHIKRHTPPRM